MQTPLSLVWDLDSIFPGGSASDAFHTYLNQIEQSLNDLKKDVPLVPIPTDVGREQGLVEIVDRFQSLETSLQQAAAFTSCLVSQNVEDRRAGVARARVRKLHADVESLATRMDEKFLQISDALWTQLLTTPGLDPVAAALDERRRWARRKLSPDREALVEELAVDGYHAWGELYNEVAGAMRITFDDDGTPVDLSMGQAQNKMTHHPDRDVRTRLFKQFESAWEKHAELCAAALNHLAGFRQAVYHHRSWDSILEEPLELNRMSRGALDAMWEAVESGKPVLKEYLARKAQLMGVSRLSFYDVDAPIGQSARELSYDEAALFITRQFERFSPNMSAFARRAFESRWIEAEDRTGKRAGGFCTSLPETGESRIFLTFDNTINSAATIAHELGHAFHHSVFQGVPYLQTNYPLNLAETASTLAEQIVADAGLQAAADEEERLALLDAKARKSVAFLMNIRARFLFELDFYKERERGIVPVDRLNELMLSAQRTAYDDALEEYHPLFWASKLHFYITYAPFYNFPYTFGYLFSNGIYEWALHEGKDFEARYAALLRDTGFMRTEALAKKHFGEDLTDTVFWRHAVERSLAAVKEFLQVTAGKAGL